MKRIWITHFLPIFGPFDKKARRLQKAGLAQLNKEDFRKLMHSSPPRHETPNPPTHEPLPSYQVQSPTNQMGQSNDPIVIPDLALPASFKSIRIPQHYYSCPLRFSIRGSSKANSSSDSDWKAKYRNSSFSPSCFASLPFLLCQYAPTTVV